MDDNEREIKRLLAQPPKFCSVCRFAISILNDTGFCGACQGKKESQ